MALGLGVRGVGGNTKKLTAQLADIVSEYKNMLDDYTVTTGYIYIRLTQNTEANANGLIYDLIPIKKDVTYYFKNLYAYFCTIQYDDGTKVALSDDTSSANKGSFTATKDGTVAITISKARSDYLLTTSKEMYNVGGTVTQDVIANDMVKNVYTVEKDGTGDFDSLVDAINEVTLKMGATIRVGEGTWDLIDELGEDYINTVGYYQRGLVLKNRVELILASKAIVTCHYTGTRADTISWLSAFNTGINGCSIRGGKIRSSKCRYSIHDERDINPDFYENNFIDCDIEHDSTNGGNSQCIGGGLGLNGNIKIEGCTFDNPNRSNYGVVSYHNTSGDGLSKIEIKDNYVKGTNTFRFSWYGTGTDITTVLASNNNLGDDIIVAEETSDGSSPNVNVELVEWNNVVRV